MHRYCWGNPRQTRHSESIEPMLFFARRSIHGSLGRPAKKNFPPKNLRASNSPTDRKRLDVAEETLDKPNIPLRLSLCCVWHKCRSEGRSVGRVDGGKKFKKKIPVFILFNHCHRCRRCCVHPLDAIPALFLLYQIDSDWFFLEHPVSWCCIA